MVDHQVNYVITVEPHGIKLYPWETREIEKESDEIDISVSKAKDIIDHFLSLANKYG